MFAVERRTTHKTANVANDEKRESHLATHDMERRAGPLDRRTDET